MAQGAVLRAPPGRSLGIREDELPEYVATLSPILVEVPSHEYLAVPGRGRPGGEYFQDRLSVLFAIDGVLRATARLARRPIPAAGLEAIWHDIPAVMSGFEDDEQQRWTLLLRAPSWTTEYDVDSAARTVGQRRRAPEAADARLLRLEEGLSAQSLHPGPLADVPATVDRLRKFAHDKGLSFHGWLHEIYLTDPRRTLAMNLRTIVRQPICSRHRGPRPEK
jgi:hypothetical protein